MRNALSWTETQTWTLLQRIFFFFFSSFSARLNKKEDVRRFCNFFSFFVQSASTYLRPGCWNMFTAVHNGSQLLSFMQFQLMYFFSQPPPTSKRGPCQCQLDCNSRRDVGGGCVCVCLCVSVCGLCRFGPEPSPWHICVDKHIFTHLLPLDAVAFRGRCWESEEVWCVKGRYLPHTDLWLSTTHFPHGALMHLELFWVRLWTFSTFIWFAEGTVMPCFYPERCCFRCQTRKMGLFDLKKREWRSDPLIHSLPDSHGFGGIRRRHVPLSEDSWCLPSICRSSWDSKWWPNMLIKNGKLGRLAF